MEDVGRRREVQDEEDDDEDEEEQMRKDDEEEDDGDSRVPEDGVNNNNNDYDEERSSLSSSRRKGSSTSSSRRRRRRVVTVRGGMDVMVGKPLVLLACGSLVYYHCSYRRSTLLSLLSDVFIVLLSSLAILGMLFRQMNISVPVDPLEWQLSPDAANCFAACLANTIGAAESVLRVAASGHDKRLFFKVVIILYVLSSLGRLASGATVAYAGLCLFCLYMLAQNSELLSKMISRRRESTGVPQDST